METLTSKIGRDPDPVPVPTPALTYYRNNTTHCFVKFADLTALTPLGQKIEQKREFDRDNTTRSKKVSGVIVTPCNEKLYNLLSIPMLQIF